MNFDREIEAARRLRAEAEHLCEVAQTVRMSFLATCAKSKAGRNARRKQAEGKFSKPFPGRVLGQP
jgi:hypothetical protein